MTRVNRYGDSATSPTARTDAEDAPDTTTPLPPAIASKFVAEIKRLAPSARVDVGMPGSYLTVLLMRLREERARNDSFATCPPPSKDVVAMDREDQARYDLQKRSALEYITDPVDREIASKRYDAAPPQYAIAPMTGRRGSVK